jgi:outer membrane protein assembly factor BamE
MKKLSLFLGACVALLCHTGCSYLPNPGNLVVYKIDVHQGNIVTQDMLAQLQTGMEKEKVKIIMGTPLIMDTFHPDRWDYVYSEKERWSDRSQRRISLFFKDDRLTTIQGGVKRAPGNLPPPVHKEVLVDVPGEAKPSLFNRIKSTVGLGDKPADTPDLTQPAAPQTTATPPPLPETQTSANQPAGLGDEESGLFARELDRMENRGSQLPEEDGDTLEEDENTSQPPLDANDPLLPDSLESL